MANTSWLKQSLNNPLSPEVLWSQPETKLRAGKLLIVGGNKFGFSAVAQAYEATIKAGAGSVRVLLPQALKLLVEKFLAAAEFAPATPSGSFGLKALADLVELAKWSDGVLLIGDFGKNSETAIALEKFIKKYSGPLTIAGDTVDYFLISPELLLKHDNLVITTDVSRLQKLLKPQLIKHQMDLLSFVTKLREATMANNLGLVTYHQKQIVVSVGGQISTTPAETIDLSELSAYISVWQLQQPQKLFEALTSAVYVYRQTA